jgi:hypothetical protein
MLNDRTEMAQPAHSLDDDRETIPLVEERAVVRKRNRLTGGVRVRTIVREDDQVIDGADRWWWRVSSMECLHPGSEASWTTASLAGKTTAVIRTRPSRQCSGGAEPRRR